MCISKLFIVVGHDSVDVRDSVRRKKTTINTIHSM